MEHPAADGFALLQVTRSSFIMYIQVKHEYLLSLMMCSTLCLQVGKKIHTCAVSDEDVACYCGTLWELHLHISFWVLLSVGKSKLQGHFHLTNLMYYVLLWIVKKYKLYSGVILALLKHHSVICKVESADFFLFFCFILVAACHLATVEGKLAVTL